MDDYLVYLKGEWDAVPAIAAEWDEWEDHEQLDFAIEWPIREDRLHQLQQWTNEGLLTPAQRDRFEELLALVNTRRPLIERLLSE